MSIRRSTATVLLLGTTLYTYGCGDDGADPIDQVIPPAVTADAGGSVSQPSPSPTADAGGSTTPTPTPTGSKDSGSAPQPQPNRDAGNPDDPGNPGGQGDAGGSGPKPDGGTSTPATDGGTPEAGPGNPGNPPGTESGCLDGITDFAKAGPFKFNAKTSGAVKMWVPEVPAGCKIPVVHLANGTGASCSNYGPVLQRLASHGFLAACYENANTGAGKQGVQAIDTARMMHPQLVSNAIGSTGHSQGGQAAFTVLQQAESKWGDSFIYAGLAIEPASGFGEQPSPGPWQTMYSKIKSPMFMFSGTADILVSAGWVMQGFNALADTIEAYNWSANGATHIPVPNNETIEVAIPWFRWKLLGDNNAYKAFKALIGSRWKEVKAQNAKMCQ